MVANGFGWMTVFCIASRTHFNKNDRAIVERNDIDVTAQHPLAEGKNAVPEPTKILRRLGFAAMAEGVS